MFTELTEDTLEQLLASNPKVMVQYGASWCGNCKITKPKFKRMAEENADKICMGIFSFAISGAGWIYCRNHKKRKFTFYPDSPGHYYRLYCSSLFMEQIL